MDLIFSAGEFIIFDFPKYGQWRFILQTPTSLVIKGLLGIGGGVLFVPLLLVAVGLRIHMAVGTSLAVVVLSSIFGTALYGQSGEVNMLLVMSLLLGSAVGVQIGAWLCRELHAEKLQRSFGYVVLLAAVLVGVDLVLKLAKG